MIKAAPGKTIFVITTDGMENASHKYTVEQVKDMITRQKEKYGWEFLFIGANIDAVGTAANYGINRDRAVNYCCDSVGTKTVYESVEKAILGFRKNDEIIECWSKYIEEDYKRRNGSK